MAVTVDVYTESLRTDTTSPQTWSHAGGTPQGVLVGAIHGTSSTDHITAVSYGALTLTRCQRNVDTTTEPGAAEWWSSRVGDTIPTGTQTVSVTCGATTDDILFCSITLNGARSLTSVYVGGIDGNTANPSVTMLYGLLSGMSFAAMYSGLTAHGSGVLAGGTGVTKLTADAQELAGNFTGAFFRQTTGGTADFAMAVTSATDDVAYACVTMAEYRLVTDSCAVVLTDTARPISAVLAVTDSSQVGLTEGAPVIVTSIASGDTVVVSIADGTSTVSSSLAVTESVAIISSESIAISLVAVSMAESLSVSVGDSATGESVIYSTDSLAIQSTESVVEAVSFTTAPDSFGVTIGDSTIAMRNAYTESFTLRRSTLRGGDTLRGGLDVQADTVEIHFTEFASIVDLGSSETVATSDTYAVQISEQANISTVGDAIDSLLIGLSEAASLNNSGSTADSTVVQLSESATASDITGGPTQVATTDSLSVSILDTASQFSVTSLSQDTVSVFIGDSTLTMQSASAGSFTMRRSTLRGGDVLRGGLDVQGDVVVIHFTESASIVVSLTTTDTISIQLSIEQASVQDIVGITSVQVVDSCAIDLDEVAVIQASVSAADVADAFVSEAEALINSVLDTSETLLCGFSEAAEILGLVAAQDDIAIALDEVANVAIPVSASDDFAIVASDGSIASQVVRNATHGRIYNRMPRTSRQFNVRSGSTRIVDKMRW